MEIKQIQSLITQEKYRFTFHAELERDADLITGQEIKESLLSPKAKIIEDYPNDPRGPSCLILGFTEADLPIHLVCGVGDSEVLIIITIYRPDSDEWIDWQIRKEKEL